MGCLVARRALTALILLTVLGGCQKEPEKQALAQVSEYLSPVTDVEAIYPSMMGPADTINDLRLQEETGKPELIWVTGYRADMVDPTGARRVSDELMCHNTLSFHTPVKGRKAMFGSGFNLTGRLFTLSQGQSEIHFPEGFGIPAVSAEPFMLQSQVLNLRESHIGMQVRHQVETKYIPDHAAPKDMQALTLVDFGINLDIEDPQAEEPPSNPLGCATDAGGNPTPTIGGREFTSHWVVKPGKETRTSKIVGAFPWDTTVHYISVHVHPYAKYLELYDLTADESVFKAECEPSDDGEGLKKIAYYSSAEGLEVYRDHEYRLISHYNNDSGKDQTAMAFMFCYVKDPTFEKPDSSDLEARSLEFCSKPE